MRGIGVCGGVPGDRGCAGGPPARLTLLGPGPTLAVRGRIVLPEIPPLADAMPQRAGWAFRPVPPTPRSIVELLRAGTLDAELAATVWVLIEGRVPVIVAADGGGAGKTTLLDALLTFLPDGVTTHELAGSSETFDWLPQATELGWQGALPTRAGTVRPDTTVLLVPELSDHLPTYTWGAEARIAIRAASVGYGLAATIHADSLDEVFVALRRPPVEADDDELSRLGVVLVLRHLDDGRRRIAAAHYVRPTARDEHGHVQRLGPAVLATWDADRDRFEHFGWGITPELALRVGRRAGDFELEVERRRDYLTDLATAGVVALHDVRTAIAAYRTHSPTLAT